MTNFNKLVTINSLSLTVLPLQNSFNSLLINEITSDIIICKGQTYNERGWAIPVVNKMTSVRITLNR